MDRGRIETEYGLGRMRTDLLLVWPVGGQVRKTVIECKLLRGSLERTLRDVLEWTFQVSRATLGDPFMSAPMNRPPSPCLVVDPLELANLRHEVGQKDSCACRIWDIGAIVGRRANCLRTSGFYRPIA